MPNPRKRKTPGRSAKKKAKARESQPRQTKAKKPVPEPEPEPVERTDPLDEATAAIVDSVTIAPGLFHAPSSELRGQLASVSKFLYDHNKNIEKALSLPTATQTLSSLFVDGLDSEQIWQQLQQHNASVEYLERAVEGFLTLDDEALAQNSTLPVHEVMSYELRESNDAPATVDNSDNDGEDSDEFPEEMYTAPSASTKKDTVDSEENEDSSDDDEDMAPVGTNAMDEASDNEDDSSSSSDDSDVLGEATGAKPENEDLLMDQILDDMDMWDDEDMGIDLDMEEDADADMTLEALKKKARALTYTDMFLAPEDWEKPRKLRKDDIAWEAEDEVEAAAQAEKKDLFSSGESDSEDSSDFDSDAAEDPQGISNHAKRQNKLAEQIALLEAKIVHKRDWELTGEVDNTNRPADSLLDKELEVDIIAKPSVPMTEEQHEKLTDMIKQRILDNAFDDVEREAEDEVPEVRKERVVLSEEKSKLSLAQIYEQDFLESQRADGQTDKDDKLSAQQAEATKLWTELSYRLDALSNYHFTPRPVTKELEVISSKPAIAMEEAIPMHVSDAQLMAPEESYRSQVSGAPIADSEKSREERKAIRNARRNKAKRIKNGQAITEQDMLDANVREMQATGQVLDAFAAQASSIAAGETQPDKVKYNVSTSFFQELEKQIEAGPEGQFNKVQKAKKKKAKKTKNWKL